jgi:hypothetical protein
MKKSIIILSGTPEGKNKFDEIAKKTSWIWAINPNNRLGDISKNSLFWDGEKSESFQKFLSEFRQLANKYLDFEASYVRSMVEKFLSDDDAVKVSPDGKKFEKFLLVVHGMRNDLYPLFEENYGAFQIHISSRSLNTNVESHDLCLYDDDDDFEQKVDELIGSLTKEK